MKFQTFLNEKYIMLVDFRYDNRTPPFPVYMNPGASDYIDMKKEEAKNHVMKFFVNIRFIVDLDKKNIYVFHASKAMHDEVKEELVKEGIPLSNNLLYGVGPLEGSKIEIENIYQSPWKVSQNYECEWAKRYFTNPQNLRNKRLMDEL